MSSDSAPAARRNRPSPAPTGGRTPGIQRNLSDYLLAIRARWKMALLLAVAVAGAYYYVQSRQQPIYEAAARLRFSLGSSVTETGRSQRMSRADMETAIQNFRMDMFGQIFRSQLVDSLTDEERDLITRDYIDLDDGVRPSPASIIAQGVSVRQRDTSHFDLSFRHRNREAAQLLVLRFVDEFKQYLDDLNRKRNESAIRFMRLQVEEFRLKVERGELELQNYQKEHDVDLEKGFDNQRLQELRTALSGQQLDLIQFETYVKEIENAREEGRPLEELPFIREYGQVATFVNQIVSLKQQRDNLAVRYRDRHPRMIENSAAMAAAQRGLDEAIRQAENKVRIDYEAKKKSIARVREEFNEQDAQAARLDSLRIEFRNMQTRLATDRGLYQEMLQRQNEMQIQSRLHGPQMEMVDGGGLPGEPISPRMGKIWGLTGGIFVLLFVGYPIAMEFIDSRLRTRQAVEEVLGRNYLGQVPKVSGRRTDPYEVALEGKPRKVIEALRIVHSQFQMAVPSSQGQVVVVTSLVPGEGKSFMSLSLGTLMAKHHRQVLIIDCDLRRPSIAQGLENLNRELRKVREVHEVRQVGTDDPTYIEEVIEGLHIMSLGENPDDPTEIFEDARFKQMVQRFRHEYDMVILDTPPAGVFSDAALLGSLSDGYIMVLRHNTHSLRKVRNVVRDLEKNNVGVLGVVFNKVIGRFSRGTDDYHRGKYYSYYSRDGRRKRRSKQAVEPGEGKPKQTSGKKTSTPPAKPKEEETPVA